MEQKMKHLVIARMGKSAHDRSSWENRSIWEVHLTDESRQQMEELGGVIKGILGASMPVQIISSTQGRAKESAEALSSKLGSSKVEAFDYLWSGENTPWHPPWRPQGDSFLISRELYPELCNYFGDMPKIHELVSERRNEAEALVIVTHFEIASEYPEYFMKQEFGKDVDFKNIIRGEALCLNIPERKWTHVGYDHSYSHLPIWIQEGIKQESGIAIRGASSF